MPRGRTDSAGPAAPTGTARAAALRLLGRREYTVAELRARLLERGFPPDDAAQAIDALAAEGLADDRRAAVAHIRTGSRVKGRGRHRLRQELERRGVSPELVGELLAAHSDDEERAALERLLARKRPPGRLSMGDRRRLFQQLLRRGFAADLIARVLKEPGTDF